uniref:Uncharacterized protein n=1 Tax=Rhizophora mucronata TaxID=61149 RepID=A0A2P2P1V9_RHIMU
MKRYNYQVSFMKL